MSLDPRNILRSFLNLSPQTRIVLGTGMLAWGTIGLYLTDKAEKNMGLEATQADKDALRAAIPRIVQVEKDDDSRT
ncbi:hypothetical protein B0O99DRAFT_689112 [Bisporella sp. PMI_857]|nr:hypothetical protein B0O99DRAFT_689112 [Bisporella sp. PMI_857]